MRGTTRRKFPSRPRAQRVVGRGVGGLRPPYLIKLCRCEASVGVGGGFSSLHPPRLTLLRNVRRPSPPLRGGRGKQRLREREPFVLSAGGEKERACVLVHCILAA